MRNVFSCSHAGSLGLISGAALGMMLAVLSPGELVAEMARIDVAKLDNKGTVTDAMAQVENRLGLPAGEPHPGAVVVDTDQGTLRWWPYFAGQTFLIEARLVEGSETVELWALAGFETRTSVVEAAGKSGAALLSVTSDKARSDDPWASGDSWSAKLEVGTSAGSKDQVLALAKNLKNTETVAERIDEVADLLATGVTEEVVATYMTFDVLPLVLNLADDDLQYFFNPSQYQALATIWDILDPENPWGERTSASCNDLRGGRYTISCSASQGTAVCHSSLNPFDDWPAFVCSGITDHCSNWRAASCWCSNQPPAPCQPGQLGPLSLP